MEWIKQENQWFKDLQHKDKYYLSNEITKDDVKELIEIHKTKRVMVSVNTPMGTGKTQFLLRNLLPIARELDLKVLLITGRKLLREQIRKDYYSVNKSQKFIKLGNYDVDIECYQKIGKVLQSTNGYEELKDKYDIIIVDEAHQLMLDALFSFDNELVVEFLTELSNSMLWLITATDDVVEPFFNEFTGFKAKITGKIDFSMLDSVVIGNERQIVNELAEEVTPDTKIFSITSKLLTKGKDGESGVPTELVKFLLDLSEDEKYSVGTLVGESFVKTHENDKVQEYVQLIEQLKTPIINKQLQCRILVSSEVAREGVEILDDHMDIVITDFICYDELMQSINRVRKLVNVKLYIVCHNKQALIGKLRTLKNNYKKAIPMFWEWYNDGRYDSLNRYIEKHNRTTKVAKGLYRTETGEIKLRKALMCKVVYTIQILESILEVDKGYYMPHSSYIKDILMQHCNIDESKIIILVQKLEDDERQKRADEVDQYLIVKTLSDKREYVITDNKEKTDLAMLVGAVNSKGKASLQIRKINEMFIKLELGDKYVLTSENRRIKGVQIRVWIVKRIDEIICEDDEYLEDNDIFDMIED